MVVYSIHWNWGWMITSSHQRDEENKNDLTQNSCEKHCMKLHYKVKTILASQPTKEQLHNQLDLGCRVV